MTVTEVAVPGLKFPEGPRWHAGAFWFSDQLGGGIHRVEENGHHELMATLIRPSGLGFPPDGGGVLIAMMDDPAVVLLGAAGSVEEVADIRPLARYLNDMFVDPSGRVYVDAYGGKPHEGSLVLAAPGREPRVVADGLAYPNGVAATPDGSTLLVAETFGGRITAFDIADDGSLGNRRVRAELPGRAPDGLCLDTEGAAWVGCYRSAEFIRVLHGGTVTDQIRVPGRWTTACALGGTDGRSLFLCTAETDARRYFAGESAGHVEIRRVRVSGVGRP